MPLSVYCCPRCGIRVERLMPLRRADDAPACPACGSAHTRRTITAAVTIGAGRSATAAVTAPRAGIT